MDGHKTVTATFTAIPYTLDVQTTGNGQIIKNPDQPTYTYGTVVELIANAGDGWSFSSWGGDATGTQTTTTVTITGNMLVTADFTLDPLYIFEDDFESGNFAAWSGSATEGTGSTATVTTINPHNGDYSGQFTIPAGTGGTTRRAYSNVNLGNFDTVYAWAYVYMPNDLSLANGQKLFVIRLNNAAGALASYGVIADSSGMHWGVQYAGWPNAVGTSAPSGGAWYLLEAYFARTETTVTLTLTVDDQEVATLNYDVSTTPVTSGWFGQAYYTGAGALTVHVDDVAISDHQISTTTYSINLQSQQDTATTSNMGTITVQGTDYALPNTATKQAGLYSVEYTAATGYSFDRWETTGAVTVADPNSAATTFTVSGDCTLTAIYLEEPVESAYLVVRGLESQIWYRQYDAHSTVWSEWSALPSGMTYDSVATVVCNNKLYLTTQAMDGLSMV